MKLMSMTYVSSSTMMKVVRMDTAAITSGTRARNEAKTKSSTARAPRAPSSVSARTLGAAESLPSPAASSW